MSTGGAIDSEPVEIKGRPRQLSLQEVEQRLRACPTAEQFRDGFVLQPADVSEVMAAAQDVLDGQIFADASLPPEQSLNTLVRALRLLQVGLDLQLTENEEMSDDFNRLQNEFSDLEDRERRARVENENFRQRLDTFEDLSDPDAARGKVEELKRLLDVARMESDMHSNNSKFKDDKINDLEEKNKIMSAREDSYGRVSKDLETKLSKLTADYIDLQKTFSEMSANQAATQSKGRIEDNLRHQDWKLERVTRDNKALEAQNAESRNQLLEIKQENLENAESRNQLLEIKQENLENAESFDLQQEIKQENLKNAESFDLQQEIKQENLETVRSIIIIMCVYMCEAQNTESFDLEQEIKQENLENAESRNQLLEIKQENLENAESFDLQQEIKQENLENAESRNQLLEIKQENLENSESFDLQQEIKQENLEVSEKIVLLDEQVRALKLRAGEAEGVKESLLGDKEALLAVQDDLRAEMSEKMALLDEFEDKFTRQFRSWEEEKANLLAQLDAQRRELRGTPGRRSRGLRASGGSGVTTDGEEAEDLAELREALDEAREKEVLLLEAYEQLEADVGKEIDKALSKEREERKTLERRAEFLQRKLDEEKEHVMALKENHYQLEDDLKGYKIRNRQYEEGVYGLPQAVEELHALKDALYKEESRVRTLVDQMNKLNGRMEDLFDENAVLRRDLGLSDTDKVDIKDLRMQKEGHISQLRSLNALLERQVADLEEERRKLRMEMKFRAKYHGQAALQLGLSPEQLLLLEQYVDGLKNGRLEEGRLVDQLMKRIEFLEVRLSEVMAYADIPPSMRPALSEFDLVSAMVGGGTGPGLLDGVQGRGGGGGGGGGGLSAAGSAQLEAAKGAIFKALNTLRGLCQTLGERGMPREAAACDDASAQCAEAQNALTQLGALSRSGNATGSGPGGAGAGGAPSTPTARRGGGVAVGIQQQAEVGHGSSYLADAMADQLRHRLTELARQCADLQVDVTKKDAQIKALIHQKAEVERKYGVPMSERTSDFVPRSDYEDARLEVAGFKEQLVAVMEELASRERELQELQDVHHRYHSKMQTYSDQVKMLYREHANALTLWRGEKKLFEKTVNRLRAEAEAARGAEEAIRKGLEAATRAAAGGPSVMEHELMDTVRRMAVVQSKHAKLAREYEASVQSERGLTSQVEELQEEVRDVSSTCRARMRWLEAAAEQSGRRLESLFRELQLSAPLSSYRSLVQRQARLQAELRRLVEEQAEAVLGCEDLIEMRHELTESMSKMGMLAEENSRLREQMRQAAGAQAASSAKAFDAQLGQELVSERVLHEGAARRLSLAESERGRVAKSLSETQAHSKELESRLAAATGELSMALSCLRESEGRFAGCLTRGESDALVARLKEAEEYASKADAQVSGLSYRAQDAEKRLAGMSRDRKRYLAEITTLKAALRDVSARSEQAAIIGKLHLEVDHLRAKEGLSRNALNRSELERLELEKELKRLRADQTKLGARLAVHQDQARWADKQRTEAQAQLELGLAARTEQWKAKLWARKLDQLKQRNDAAADGLDLARRRIKRLEDAREDAESKAKLAAEVEGLLKRGTSEVVRDAARLNETLMQMRLERGKLAREEVLLREKVHYVERVNAELHELLERYEAEFFQHQLQLEGDRQSEAAHAKLLQDDCVRLQERVAALVASGGQRDTDAHGDQDGKPGRGGSGLRSGAEAVGGRIRGMLTAHTQADRDTMLRQIEALKTARQEAEGAKQEVGRLGDELSNTYRELADVRRHHNDALARLKEQSEGMLYALDGRGPGGATETAVNQMRAVAEATINELKDRLTGRDRQIAELQALLDATKAQWLAQHQTDRDELARINQALFDRNNTSIDNLKGLLRGGPATHDQSSLELEQMRALAERRADEANVLRNQLEQKDAAIELIRNNYDAQVSALEAQIRRLQDELSRPRDDAPSRILAERLGAELRRKDERLRKLDAAVKTIQGQLADALKKRADEAMAGTSWRQQERQQERIVELEGKNRELLAQAQAARDDAADARAQARAAGPGGDAAAVKAAEQIAAARARAAELEVELSRERARLMVVRGAEKERASLTHQLSRRGPHGLIGLPFFPGAAPPDPRCP
ncbi:hypothetical protein FOA52_013917 [Chlamydomonas sp. UWO 241]|nr:hypothetical protein FOA52_013917 [Chlamydomonas sp. UWO 241]